MPPTTTHNFDVFISLRFGEARHAARGLEKALQAHGLRVFLCDIAPGGDIARAVIRSLHGCKMAVLLGTRTYGQQTASKFSTYEELRYIIDQEKPFFLVKMCDDFVEPETKFHLPSNVAYFPWLPEGGDVPDMDVPVELVDAIIAKLKTLPDAPKAPAAPLQRHQHGYGALPPPNIPLMGREEAEVLLLDRDDCAFGDYVVRRSKADNQVAISLVAHDQVVEHHLLQKSANGDYQLNNHPLVPPCKDLTAALEHLSSNQEGMTRTYGNTRTNAQPAPQLPPRPAPRSAGAGMAPDNGVSGFEDHPASGFGSWVNSSNDSELYESVVDDQQQQLHAQPDTAVFRVHAAASGTTDDNTLSDNNTNAISTQSSSASLLMRAAPAGLKAFGSGVGGTSAGAVRVNGGNRQVPREQVRLKLGPNLRLYVVYSFFLLLTAVLGTVAIASPFWLTTPSGLTGNSKAIGIVSFCYDKNDLDTCERYGHSPKDIPIEYWRGTAGLFVFAMMVIWLCFVLFLFTCCAFKGLTRPQIGLLFLSALCVMIALFLFGAGLKDASFCGSTKRFDRGDCDLGYAGGLGVATFVFLIISATISIFVKSAEDQIP
ncbi:hypothetical protein PTSG_05359 [Salpingoeca rosetta]|uniref:SH2 domain-containing protein n=1 Tax=Salpingoeca rosetta (strain ATCC 50818 / BSB-021) TaxID=946362 RepID=F2UA74_SALR5|nr:uncharacterized protein PTSG_05359 [Salpingoeca rosetta]EGD73649.1 hypothetical protein PTSG_05359 [Salpingoeca rosetta]|eukprot:XP_004993930.1 hypothetical protein PTSG_05359 [Salpingoeca rosetta]